MGRRGMIDGLPKTHRQHETRLLIRDGAFKITSWTQGDNNLALKRTPKLLGDTRLRLDHGTFKPSSADADPHRLAIRVSEWREDARRPFRQLPRALKNLPQFRVDPRFQVLVGLIRGPRLLCDEHSVCIIRRCPRQAVAHPLTDKPSSTGNVRIWGTPIGTHFAPHNPSLSVDQTALRHRMNVDKSKAATWPEAGFCQWVFETTLDCLSPFDAPRRGNHRRATRPRSVYRQDQQP